MLRLIAVVFVAGALAAPAAAQQLLGGYFAYIGVDDMYNSKGVRLTDLCAIVQQDRANYHRFGIRQQYDDDDPWFRTPEARKVLGASCVIGAGSEYIPEALRRGEERYIRVQVFGRGGVPAWVEIHEGAG